MGERNMLTTNFQMPEKVQLDESSYSNTFGRFILQPLEKGYGVTIGNAFRRILLSSLPGTAFTAIRIEGILHEFSTIPGVVEDVSEMILNLKAVRLKLMNKKLNRVVVQVKGPKDFTAADIQKSNPEIEILNPSQHIATLNVDSEFELELRIGRGKGYVTAEENKLADQSTDVITIDSIFTPVKNVRFFVESTRVGQKTDYEKLTIEIETDGSIAPDDTLAQAALILRDHIQLFLSFNVDAEAQEELLEKDSEFTRIRKILQMSVDELELSVRSHNCLKAANIKTIADLVRRDEPELLKFKNFGRKSLAELSEIIEQFGLKFGMEVEKYLHESNE